MFILSYFTDLGNPVRGEKVREKVPSPNFPLPTIAHRGGVLVEATIGMIVLLTVIFFGISLIQLQLYSFDLQTAAEKALRVGVMDNDLNGTGCHTVLGTVEVKKYLDPGSFYLASVTATPERVRLSPPNPALITAENPEFLAVRLSVSAQARCLACVALRGNMLQLNVARLYPIQTERILTVCADLVPIK